MLSGCRRVQSRRFRQEWYTIITITIFQRSTSKFEFLHYSQKQVQNICTETGPIWTSSWPHVWSSAPRPNEVQGGPYPPRPRATPLRSSGHDALANNIQLRFMLLRANESSRLRLVLFLSLYLHILSLKRDNCYVQTVLLSAKSDIKNWKLHHISPLPKKP